MQSVGDLFSQPVFLCLTLTVLVAAVNIIIGINIHPINKKHKDLHRYLYYVVVAGYMLFMAINYSKNTWLEYFVFLYLLLVVPWVRGVNVTLHAILSSAGLFLLVLIAALSIF